MNCLYVFGRCEGRGSLVVIKSSGNRTGLECQKNKVSPRCYVIL